MNKEEYWHCVEILKGYVSDCIYIRQHGFKHENEVIRNFFAVTRVINSLTEAEFGAYIEFFIKGASITAAALELNASERTVNRLKKNIIQKTYKEIERERYEFSKNIRTQAGFSRKEKGGKGSRQIKES